MSLRVAATVVTPAVMSPQIQSIWTYIVTAPLLLRVELPVSHRYGIAPAPALTVWTSAGHRCRQMVQTQTARYSTSIRNLSIFTVSISMTRCVVVGWTGPHCCKNPDSLSPPLTSSHPPKSFLDGAAFRFADDAPPVFHELVQQTVG